MKRKSQKRKKYRLNKRGKALVAILIMIPLLIVIFNGTKNEVSAKAEIKEEVVFAEEIQEEIIEEEPEEVVEAEPHAHKEDVEQEAYGYGHQFVGMDVLCGCFLHAETEEEVEGKKEYHVSVDDVEGFKR